MVIYTDIVSWCLVLTLLTRNARHICRSFGAGSFYPTYCPSLFPYYSYGRLGCELKGTPSCTRFRPWFQHTPVPRHSKLMPSHGRLFFAESPPSKQRNMCTTRHSYRCTARLFTPDILNLMYAHPHRLYRDTAPAVISRVTLRQFVCKPIFSLLNI